MFQMGGWARRLKLGVLTNAPVFIGSSIIQLWHVRYIFAINVLKNMKYIYSANQRECSHIMWSEALPNGDNQVCNWLISHW